MAYTGSGGLANVSQATLPAMIERGKGEFWVFPSKGAKQGFRPRRWLPELMWKFVRKTEGFQAPGFSRREEKGRW